MEIFVKQLDISELEQALWVELASMSGGHYLEAVAPLFFDDKQGAMLGAVVAGKIVGIAKYTVLYDGTAWLETLRVHPDYQRKGVGRRLYEEFVKLSQQKNIHSMAMYTGVNNVASAGLARQFGLEKAQAYRELSLNLQGLTMPKQVASFIPATPARACQLLQTLQEAWKGFLVFNRTFFHMNTATYEGLAAEGKVLESDGAFLAFGNRFMPERSIQIGIMGGNLQKCIDYAIARGIEKGVPALTIVIPPEDLDLQELLENNGFTVTADIMVMEGAL